MVFFVSGDPAPAAGQHDAAGDHHGDAQAPLLGPRQGHALRTQGDRYSPPGLYYASPVYRYLQYSITKM